MISLKARFEDADNMFTIEIVNVKTLKLQDYESKLIDYFDVLRFNKRKCYYYKAANIYLFVFNNYL